MKHDLSTWTMNHRSEFFKQGLKIVQVGFRSYEVYNPKGKYMRTERTLYRAMSRVENLIKVYENQGLL